jgi:hypothetical protein
MHKAQCVCVYLSVCLSVRVCVSAIEIQTIGPTSMKFETVEDHAVISLLYLDIVRHCEWSNFFSDDVLQFRLSLRLHPEAVFRGNEAVEALALDLVRDGHDGSLGHVGVLHQG